MRVETLKVAGLTEALIGMRNPLNSWYLNDTKDDIIGEKDLGLAQRLIKAGNEHCKFMRQVQVWVNITAPRYWWSEFDTYKVGTSANSTSTMHKLFDKKTEIKLNMFEVHNDFEKRIINNLIKELNILRDNYFIAENQEEKNIILTMAKRILPEGYLNLRTVNLNYSVLRNIVQQRKNHRLKYEWQDCFCRWVTTLPYSKEFIFYGMEDEFEGLKGE
ncbi:MAG: hypothetical protein E6182_10185 [Clostridioides difficile]|nr:hypothetical protein [Clostridioides difficile]